MAVQISDGRTVFGSALVENPSRSLGFPSRSGHALASGFGRTRAAPQDLLFALRLEGAAAKITVSTKNFEAVVKKQCFELAREVVPVCE